MAWHWVKIVIATIPWELETGDVEYTLSYICLSGKYYVHFINKKSKVQRAIEKGAKSFKQALSGGGKFKLIPAWRQR